MVSLLLGRTLNRICNYTVKDNLLSSENSLGLCVCPLHILGKDKLQAHRLVITKRR